MPIYEYQCESCKDKIELIQSFKSESPLCKKCLAQGKSIKMKKVISRNNFHLKGDGWYKDHYGLKENKK